MVLGTLFLFAVLVVVIHVLAISHATVPLRLDVLRVVADGAARDLADGRRPILAEPYVFAVVSPAGRVVAGRLPLGRPGRGDAVAPTGERCAPRGTPCWALRHVGEQRLLVYPHLHGASSLHAPVSLALLGSVLAWLVVSALAGLVLLRSLRRADESRRRLLAGLAHDLGTPLTSIRGFAETQLEQAGGAPPAPHRRVWTVVYREALRMQRLIEDMLALTRLEAGRMAIVPRPFDLREVLEAAAERAAMAHGQAPALDLPPAPATIHADRDRIDQVLANLVDNAYRHGGGEVRLALTHMEGVSARRTGGFGGIARAIVPGRSAARIEPPEVKLAEPSHTAGVSAWRITVSDAGAGLSSEARAHLYEPFRPWGSGRGSGLGLAIAREIVALHGGRLDVEDAHPGCRVTVDLPVAAPHAGAR